MHFTVGQKIFHPEYGEAIVQVVGEDYVGLKFPDGQQGLFKKEDFTLKPSKIEKSAAGKPFKFPWPQSTFVEDGEDDEHYPGVHWHPFVDDVTQIMRKLPDFLQTASVKNALGLVLKPERTLPEEWEQGFVLAWPSSEQGVAIGIRTTEAGNNEIVTLFPFTGRGSQHLLTVRKVRIWKDGLTAHMDAFFGDAELSFFDTDFVANRGWYEAGQPHEFILAGLAYNAQPSTISELPFILHRDVLAWQSQMEDQQGEAPVRGKDTISLIGMSMLIPLRDGDLDEYSFRGQVIQVESFSDFLSQKGWRTRVRVIRDSPENMDLDIWVTEKVWEGKHPPQVGEDIEGVLWLQGHLWSTSPMDDDEL